ncbi:hypothetical protein [Ruminiclostridium josui]|nr:hypothetical protein [Ruminiclostridium josui]
MTSYDTEGNTTQSEIMMYNYFNSEIFNVISEFVNELADIADIIEDKKAFSLSLIKNYYKINLPETQINEYLTFVMQVVNMTEKHIHDILSNILLLDEKLKIVDIHCSLVKRSAVITFSHNRKIIFRNSSLNDEQIFNSIIRWVNFKVDERYQLYIRKIISYGSYGF